VFRPKNKQCDIARENNTGQESKSLLGSMSAAVTVPNLGEIMPSRLEKKVELVPERSQLSERDVRLLLILCAELVNFCVRVTGKSDPTASAMLAYVRDEIRLEGKSLQK
jgi:hypothetical protein